MRPYLTNFITESAEQMMCDVVTRIQHCSCINVFLELETIQDLLLDPLELSPAAQGDGVPLVSLGVVLIQVQCSLSGLDSFTDEIFLDIFGSILPC